jgi:hypothetical protein
MNGQPARPIITYQSLQKEIETYNARLPELLGSIGKFVLIKDDKIEGTYDTYADALKVGYERFQLQPFMVKQIAPAEKIHSRASLIWNAQHQLKHSAGWPIDQRARRGKQPAFRCVDECWPNAARPRIRQVSYRYRRVVYVHRPRPDQGIGYPANGKDDN